MNWAAILWLVLLIVFLAVEAVTVTLVSLWFAAGALAALLVTFFGAAVWLQALVFLAVSAIALAALRPVARKYIRPKITATNVDAVVGAQGYVTETVDNLAATGQVKLGSMPWTARSTDGAPIEAGTLVRVDRVEGVKAFVTPVRETANV